MAPTLRSPSAKRRAALPSSSAVSSSVFSCSVSRERLLWRFAVALAVLVGGSLLLSSVRLRCHRSSSSSSPESPHTRLGRRRHWFTHAFDDARPPHGGAEDDDAAASCSPQTLDAKRIDYLVPHKFTQLLQALDPPFPPPTLAKKHAYMCDTSGRERLAREWSYCLPISGRHDLPYCAAPDRMDLLAPHATPRSLCYSSVLHLLLVDVYAELKRHGAEPALLFGSLLGAVRNASLIPFTEDADLGFVYSPALRMKKVKDELWKKGYHLFRQGVLRVCVAPTHPLASNLYDARRDSLHRSCHVPYMDLYRMELAANRVEWEIEQIRKNRRIPHAKVKPYSHVRVNDLAFDTLADPLDFLEHEYGVEWRSPKKRGSYRVIQHGEDADLPEGPMPRLPVRYDLEDGEYDSAVDYDMPDIGDTGESLAPEEGGVGGLLEEEEEGEAQEDEADEEEGLAD